MTLAVIGAICIVLAASWICYKLWVAFHSSGGTIMVAVYDAAMFPPLLAAGGLYCICRGLEISWPIWVYPVAGIGLGVVVAIAIKIAEELGDRPL